jgi:outer membrane protein
MRVTFGLPVRAAVLAVAFALGLIAPSGTLAQQQQRQQGTPQRAPAQQAPQQPAMELPPAGTAIVVVDPQQVMNQSAAADALRAQVEKHRASYQAEVQKQMNDLRNADQELAKQRTLLSPEAYAQRRRDFEKQVSDVEQAAQNRRKEFDRAIGEAQRKIEKALVEIVVEIVQEKNYSVVVNKAGVIIVQTSLDITPEVIRRMNRKLPTVAVVLPK